MKDHRNYDSNHHDLVCNFYYLNIKYEKVKLSSDNIFHSNHNSSFMKSSGSESFLNCFYITLWTNFYRLTNPITWPN